MAPMIDQQCFLPFSTAPIENCYVPQHAQVVMIGSGGCQKLRFLAKVARIGFGGSANGR